LAVLEIVVVVTVYDIGEGQQSTGQRWCRENAGFPKAGECSILVPKVGAPKAVQFVVSKPKNQKAAPVQKCSNKTIVAPFILGAMPRGIINPVN
jgi:hypothetical protein